MKDYNENKLIDITDNNSTLNNTKNNNKIVTFLKGIGTIALYYLLAIIGSLVFGNFYNSSNKLIAGLSELGTYIIILCGLCFTYRQRLINDFKNFKKDNINIAVRNWLCGLAIMMAANMFISFIVKDIAANEAANRELLNNLPITSIITMIIIGPLIEEITFRASFKNAFSKWYTFALVTGLIFGFAHITASITPGFNPLELLYIIPYSALGFFFAKAFYETDNIYTSFLAHFIHNSLCILVLILF